MWPHAFCPSLPRAQAKPCQGGEGRRTSTSNVQQLPALFWQRPDRSACRERAGCGALGWGCGHSGLKPRARIQPARHMAHRRDFPRQRRGGWEPVPQSSLWGGGVMEMRQVRCSPSDARPTAWLGRCAPGLCRRAQATGPLCTQPSARPLMLPEKPRPAQPQPQPPSGPLPGQAAPTTRGSPASSQPDSLRVPLSPCAPQHATEACTTGQAQRGKPASVLRQGPRQPVLAAPGGRAWRRAVRETVHRPAASTSSGPRGQTATGGLHLLQGMSPRLSVGEKAQVTKKHPPPYTYTRRHIF